MFSICLKYVKFEMCMFFSFIFLSLQTLSFIIFFKTFFYFVVFCTFSVTCACGCFICIHRVDLQCFTFIYLQGGNFIYLLSLSHLLLCFAHVCLLCPALCVAFLFSFTLLLGFYTFGPEQGWHHWWNWPCGHLPTHW